MKSILWTIIMAAAIAAAVVLAGCAAITGDPDPSLQNVPGWNQFHWQ